MTLLRVLIPVLIPILCEAETRISAGSVIVPVSDCNLTTKICKQTTPLSWIQVDSELLCLPVGQFVAILRDNQVCQAQSDANAKALASLQEAYNTLKTHYDELLQTVAELRGRLEATVPSWVWGIITGGAAVFGTGVGVGIGRYLPK